LQKNHKFVSKPSKFTSHKYEQHQQHPHKQTQQQNIHQTYQHKHNNVNKPYEHTKTNMKYISTFILLISIFLSSIESVVIHGPSGDEILWHIRANFGPDSDTYNVTSQVTFFPDYPALCGYPTINKTVRAALHEQVKGKILLLHRSECQDELQQRFTYKTYSAQELGAVGVIIGDPSKQINTNTQIEIFIDVHIEK
jgi:hypothetical protein